MSSENSTSGEYHHVSAEPMTSDDDRPVMDYGGWATASAFDHYAPDGPERNGVAEALVESQEHGHLGQFLRSRIAHDLHLQTITSVVNIEIAPGLTVPVQVVITRAFVYEAMSQLLREQAITIDVQLVESSLQTALQSGIESCTGFDESLRASRDHLIMQNKRGGSVDLPQATGRKSDECLQQTAERNAVSCLDEYFRWLLDLSIKRSPLDLVRTVYAHLQTDQMRELLLQGEGSHSGSKVEFPRPTGVEDDSWIRIAMQLHDNLTGVMRDARDKVLRELRQSNQLDIDVLYLSRQIDSAVSDASN